MWTTIQEAGFAKLGPATTTNPALRDYTIMSWFWKANSITSLAKMGPYTERDRLDDKVYIVENQQTRVFEGTLSSDRLISFDPLNVMSAMQNTAKEG